MTKKFEIPPLTRVAGLDAKTKAMDDAARTFVEGEASKRNAKTARLRVARLSAEAANPVVETPKKARKR